MYKPVVVSPVVVFTAVYNHNEALRKQNIISAILK